MKRTPHTMLITLFRWSLLATLLLGFAAQAEPVARVLMANGDVRAIQSDQSVRALNRGDMLYAGDSIRTGKTSSAQFRFTDGALIALRAESEFGIEQHRYNEQTPQQNEQSGQLVRGGLRAITGAIGRDRPEAVNMRTPVATIGIRGTVYETIYIPPGGHPALPGVESGHYTVVLRGRVSISNAAGELIITDGEIAFVRDANTPPALRPDLSALFARFAALENVEEIIAELQEDAGKLQDSINILSETALSSLGSVSPGPLGMAILSSDNSSANFMSSPVSVATDGAEITSFSATNGSGGFNSLSGTIDPQIQGIIEIGDSIIYWGSIYDPEINNETLIEDVAHFISATNIFATLNSIPTTGTFNYSYIDGSGSMLESTSNLSVDFTNATMDVQLDFSYEGIIRWEAYTQDIADFYQGGITLTSEVTWVGDGNISGRFVGTGADGVIALFSLDTSDFIANGTAVFDSDSAILTPQ